MTPITKKDIQQLASQSGYLGTGDPHRVKAVLKQITSRDNIPSLIPHHDKDVFYFICDVSVVCEVARPFEIFATCLEKTVFKFETAVFPTGFDFETKHFDINRICDSLQISSNLFSRMGAPIGGLDYFPDYSVLYYELTKF